MLQYTMLFKSLGSVNVLFPFFFIFFFYTFIQEGLIKSDSKDLYC